MLNRPPPHTDAEILALVEEFAASYRPGVTILTAWLRLQAPRINGLLDAGWKWSEIAAILTRAGVIYGTGKPWTVPVLTAAYHRAKRPPKPMATIVQLPKLKRLSTFRSMFRAGGDDRAAPAIRAPVVSIHAPARRATSGPQKRP